MRNEFSIGAMDRKIEILSPTTSTSPAGKPDKSFTHLCYAWASKELAGDSPEAYVSQRLTRVQRYKFRIHYQGGIDETMRIKDGSATYNILSVDETGLFLDILAEKINP